MRAIFTQELSQVGEDLLVMSTHVATAMNKATTALLEADLERAEEVIDADAAVDELHRGLDERCVMLLARQQPVASDLRLVVSALRMSTSLERMGDLTRHVAQVARLRYPQVAIPAASTGLFERFGEAADRVGADVVELLSSHDLSLALRLERDDDVLDQLHLDTFRTTLAQDWTGTTAETVDVTLTARFYERFGDHAVALARRIQFLVTGDVPGYLP